MKKVLLIIISLVCTLSASALSYATPYKGSGRSGMVYSAPVRSTAMGSSVMAQAPVATMGSTSISMSRGIASTSEIVAAPQVRGIYTSASAIQGGVTTYDGGRHYGPRRGPGQPDPSVDPEEGEHNWVQNPDGTYTCTICGETISEEEFYNEEFPDHCVPLTDGWQVWFFLTILAGAYAIYKARARKKTY